MRILVITNMYPSEEKKISGIFVINQVNAIEKILSQESDIITYYMRRSFTKKIGTLKKYLKFFLKFLPFASKQKKKFDIIHVQYYFPTIYLALIYKFFFNNKVKIIATFHGTDFYGRKYNFMYKFPFKFLSVAIAVSNALEENIRKIYNGKITTICAGVKDSFYKKNEEKQFDLIMVSSLYPIKGIDIFYETMKIINKNIKIMIIGTGEHKYLIDNLKADTSHHIEYLPELEQDQLSDYFNKSKFLIITSRKEAFGLVISEAMRCGLPVISTKTAGASDQIVHNKNGFIAEGNENDVKTVESLASLVNKTISMTDAEYKTMSDLALEMSEKYKLSFVAEKVVSIYKDLLKSGY